MDQPIKSVAAEPIRDAADYAAWLTATLDALRLDSVCLVGMSFGGWLALNYAVAGPDGSFVTGSDFLMEGGVTAAYRYGELAPR